MGALHDGLGTDGEHFHAGIAPIVAAIACTYALIFLAMWAPYSVRPPLLLHELTGRVLVWKSLKYLDKTDSRSARDILLFVCRNSVP